MIPVTAIVLVQAVLCSAIGAAVLSGWCVWQVTDGSPFAAVASIGAVVIGFYTAVFAGTAIVVRVLPGIGSETRQIAFLGLFNYVLRFVLHGHLLPTFAIAELYRLLGARIDRSVLVGGDLVDPNLVEAGRGTVIGMQSFIYCHAVEAGKFSIAPVRLGERVTIGARAIIMQGVTIGDDAIVATGSVVRKGTVIGPGELWAGVPAKRKRTPGGLRGDTSDDSDGAHGIDLEPVRGRTDVAA